MYDVFTRPAFDLEIMLRLALPKKAAAIEHWLYCPFERPVSTKTESTRRAASFSMHVSRSRAASACKSPLLNADQCLLIEIYPRPIPSS